MVVRLLWVAFLVAILRDQWAVMLTLIGAYWTMDAVRSAFRSQASSVAGKVGRYLVAIVCGLAVFFSIAGILWFGFHVAPPTASMLRFVAVCLVSLIAAGTLSDWVWPGKKRLRLGQKTQALAAEEIALREAMRREIDSGDGEPSLDRFQVVLDSAGPKKLHVIKVLRDTFDIGLKEAKDLADAAPCPLRKGVRRAEAEYVKFKLEAEGASVNLVEQR